jgi:glutamine cyclotransferase
MGKNKNRKMNKAWLAAMAILLLLLWQGLRLMGQPALESLHYQVLNRFPHDPEAFTQGLELMDEHLLEGTGGLGKSQIRLVHLASGSVYRSRNLPADEFGEGLTRLGDQIYQLTWKNGLLHVYDAETFQLQRTLKYQGEGWGLTHDGKRLIMSDGSEYLQLRQPEDFALIASIKVTREGRPLRKLNELEYVDGVIWANIWQTQEIVRIDGKSGRVTGTLDCRGLFPWDERSGREDVLNGIAFVPQRGTFLLTGKFWPYLFEIRISSSKGGKP